MLEFTPALIALMAFAAVGSVAFVGGQYLIREIRVQHRIAAPLRERELAPRFEGFDSFVKTYFDEKRFKIDAPARSKLRLQLFRAGFFNPHAINYYIFWRLVAVVAFPVIAYLVAAFFLPDHSSLLKFGLVALSAVLAVLGPDAYI